MALKKKLLAFLAGIGALPALAADGAYASPPGLTDAINTAKTTASGMAGEILPAAVAILFAFAGLIGIWLIWRVFKRGASGR